MSPASSVTPSTQPSRCSSPGHAFPASPDSLTLDTSPLILDNINRLATNLYTELLSRLTSLINRSIKPYTVYSASIILFDSPGFQNPNTIGRMLIQLFHYICTQLYTQ